MSSSLENLGSELTAVVIGASGGIGQALVAALADDPAVGCVFAGCRRPPPAPAAGIRPFSIDVTADGSIRAAAAHVAAAGRAVDIVIVATGILHEPDGLAPEKRWEDLDPDRLAQAFAVNATGPALVARHFVPLLGRTGRTVFAVLSARVGSIADNRKGGWYGYRASKAALNMLIRTLAIELARRNRAAIAVAVHPGTVATALSSPFLAGVPDAQIVAPDIAAARLLGVIAGLGHDASGKLVAWNGETLPY